MRNIKLTVSYDGTDYKGWQIQANGRTVQEEIEKAVKKVFGKHHRISGAGRTDAGAHAKGQVANFKASSGIPVKNIPAALNACLPGDISINKAEEMEADFNSRFDARKKTYKYYILNERHRDPFTEKYAWRLPYKLNVALMRKEAKTLLGKHDFKAFQAKDKRERSSVRTITHIGITKKGTSIIITIEANGFLYNMVRNITGTLVDIGRGYLPEGSMRGILSGRDRTKAGPTAPSKGLFLAEVVY